MRQEIKSIDNLMEEVAVVVVVIVVVAVVVVAVVVVVDAFKSTIKRDLYVFM